MADSTPNVVQLPDRATRSWPVVAKGLSELLVDCGRDLAQVEKVIEELRPEYIAAWEGPTLPAGTDPDDAVAVVNAWVTGFLLRLLLITAGAKLDLAGTE